jgi:large subunit ribosomal protein L32e
MKFKRHNHIIKKLKEKWIRPRGIHNKLRLRKAGHQKAPAIGYKKPKSLKPILIKNPKELENIKTPVIIARVGLKNKIEILKKAQQLNIQVLNVKNIEEILKQVEEKKKQKQETIKQKEEKKKKFKEIAEKKAEKKETTEEKEEKKEKIEEIKKEEEKKEKKRVLEKGQ